jgi:hypothetical protein
VTRVSATHNSLTKAKQWVPRDSNPRPQPCESLLAAFRDLGIQQKAQFRTQISARCCPPFTPVLRCFAYVARTPRVSAVITHGATERPSESETVRKRRWWLDQPRGGAWMLSGALDTGIRYGMAYKQSDTLPVLASGCEELKCDVVKISKRQCRVVRRVHDATVGDAEFFQTDFPCP